MYRNMKRVACSGNHAFNLFTRHYKWECPLRSIGVQVDKLYSYEQLALAPYDACDPCVDVDTRVKRLTSRYGPLQVEESAALHYSA